MHRSALRPTTVSALLAALLAITLSLAPVPEAAALGECGLSCCLGAAGTSGVTLAQNFGLSLQYDYMSMGTIKHGTSDVSPNTVIDKFWQPGGTYAVPTKMIMQKISLVGAYPITERWQVLGILPYVINDMDMRMKGPMGMIMNHSMDTVDGVGDFTLLGLYTALSDAPIRPTQRLTLGLGLKTPTGRNDVKNASGSFVHAMMQPGTGSWDPLFLVNYMRAFYPLILQANLFYHLSTEGDEGYQFGNQFTADLIGRYQVWDYVNVGLETNIIHAGQDDDHDGKYSRPTVSMVDNPANTGITSVLLTPTLQVKLPGTGGSAELKYQRPVYQDANGYQQVLDWRLLASLTWNF